MGPAKHTYVTGVVKSQIRRTLMTIKKQKVHIGHSISCHTLTLILLVLPQDKLDVKVHTKYFEEIRHPH